MALGDRVRRRLTARAQPYVEGPVVAAANFTWPATWSTPSFATSHPELAGGLPEVVLVALTDTGIHLLAPPVGRISHDAKAGPMVRVGSWPRWQVLAERLDKPTVVLGREMPTLPQVRLTLPGRDPAVLAGAQGATPAFTAELLRAVAMPQFGDGVMLGGADGSSTPGRFLAGPRLQDGRVICWACDWHEWDIATVRQGRDPEGTLYPAEQVQWDGPEPT